MINPNNCQKLLSLPHAGYLFAVLTALSVLASHAQPLQPEVLVSFNNTNGAGPQAGLTLGSDGNFYGTTAGGGSGGYGTVFQMTTNGTLTTLVSFNSTNGAQPFGALTLGGDGNLYGTTFSGGSGGSGTVFQMTTSGTLTTLVSFDSTNGGGPQSALVLGGNGNFYGTTGSGGGGYGTVFQMTMNGTLTTLVSFNNTNGALPLGALTQGSDGNFYGTTHQGGSGVGYGTVFQITTNGTLTTLVSFANSNGAYPDGALVLGGDGNFYGTTFGGGSPRGRGTAFQMTTNGTLTTLVYFTGTNGLEPPAALTLGGDGNFYGTTFLGGNGGGSYGTVFQMTTNGTLTTLVSFNSSNGANPDGALVLGSDGNFYGTTFAGGSGGVGTVFRLSRGAPLVLSQPANQVVLGGVNVTISATAFGALPLSYQWLFNGTNLPGATSATLTLTNVGFSDHGTYTLLVANSLGTNLSSNAALTVLPVFVTTLPASGITAAGVVLNGSVTFGSEETLAWFEWGIDTNYGHIAGITDIPGGSGTVTLTNTLSGLNGDLIYHYRVVGWDSFGIEYGADQLFEVGLAPVAVTLGGIDVTTNGATLIGSVNPGGRSTTFYFRWGTTTPLGLTNLTPVTGLGNGSAPVNVDVPITGLTTGSVYYCRIVASNSLGFASAAILAFPTGPWSQTAAPFHNWDSIAASADGTKLVAVAYDLGTNGFAYTGGPIYTSADSGATWTQTSAPIGPWESVACSADGTQLVVAGGGADRAIGPIYRSVDSGATWTQTSAPSNNWYSVASSADGTKLAAVDSIGRRIYTSADSGNTWTKTTAPSNYWFSVAVSADGTKLVAGSGAYNYLFPPGPVYTSTNFGATWTSNSMPKQYWIHVSSSADGTTLMATGGGGLIYTSTNSGATWVARPGAGAREWIYSACSAEGTEMAAVARPGLIYTSTNSGATWTPNVVPNLNWNAVASSADGAFLVASVGYPTTGGIYTLRTTPSPMLSITPSEGNATISWTIPSLDFTLQQNSDLTTTNWTDVPTPPVLNLTNLQNQVTVSPTNGNNFYRLKH